MIKMIWAMDENNLIGNKDRLPWNEPVDISFLKENTENKIVVMGSNTYFSMKKYYKKKPFPFKKTYVLSNAPIEGDPQITVINNLKYIIRKYRFFKDIYVMGGAYVYAQFLPYAKELIVTIIKGKYEGDVYFPSIDFSDYKLKKYLSYENRLLFTTYRKKWRLFK